jgi:hypothetical protein
MQLVLVNQSWECKLKYIEWKFEIKLIAVDDSLMHHDVICRALAKVQTNAWTTLCAIVSVSPPYFPEAVAADEIFLHGL